MPFYLSNSNEKNRFKRCKYNENSKKTQWCSKDVLLTSLDF